MCVCVLEKCVSRVSTNRLCVNVCVFVFECMREVVQHGQGVCVSRIYLILHARGVWVKWSNIDTMSVCVCGNEVFQNGRGACVC